MVRARSLEICHRHRRQRGQRNSGVMVIRQNNIKNLQKSMAWYTGALMVSPTTMLSSWRLATPTPQTATARANLWNRFCWTPILFPPPGENVQNFRRAPTLPFCIKCTFRNAVGPLTRLFCAVLFVQFFCANYQPSLNRTLTAVKTQECAQDPRGYATTR